MKVTFSGLACLVWVCAANAASVPCSACHGETAAHFASSGHGRALAEASEVQACESCHGDAAAHVAAPGAEDTILKFRNESAADIAAACGSCHKDIHAPASSPHSQAGLTCTSCHAVHPEAVEQLEGQALGRRWQNLDAASRTCFECHSETFSEFQFNEGHRLAEGAVGCTSCHDAHAPTEGMRLGGFSDRRCDGCHADKSGPFVFEHAASRVEGCIACHSPHGSPNRHMLTHQESGEQCYTCHAGVPQFHLGFSPVAPARFNERTVCTNCHVTIHGSNLDRNFLR